MERWHESHFRERVPWSPAWKTCRPNILPSIQSLDSDTFQVNSSQLKLPNHPATRLGADTQRLSASFTPVDFESLITVLISSYVWQQWYWGSLGTENAAVTLAPFHIHYCCFQLQEFLSQLTLSLTRTLLQRAMWCTGSVQLSSPSNQIEKQREVVRGSQTWQSEGTEWTLPGLPEIPPCCQGSPTLADPADPAQVKGAALEASPPANSRERRPLHTLCTGLQVPGTICQQQTI